MIRIICLGNRCLDEDAAGPKVFDFLTGMTLPKIVEIVNGGTCGLDLFGLIESSERVVFVDALSGYATQGGVAVLTPADLPQPETFHDHAAGLPYLIAVLPLVCDRAPSEVFIVGIDGLPDDAAVAEAARVSIDIAIEGMPAAERVARKRTNA